MQLIDYLNTTNRLLYSLSQNVSKQLLRGSDYNNISKTITIGLLDYNLKELSDLSQMHTIWHFREDNSEKLLTDLEELHIIEMPKAKVEYLKNKNNLLAKWILFILYPNVEEVKSIMNENDEIKKTAQKLEDISGNDDIRAKAEILARWELEEKWNKASVFEHGKKSKAIEIAKALLKKSIDIDVISEVTGLSKDEICNLNK